jgi:hypothetical protein
VNEETARTHLGPFKIAGETAWLVPSGGIVLLVTLLTYAWILARLLFSRPLVCDVESNYVSILGLTTGVGVGLLVAAMFERSSAQVLSFLGSAVPAGIGGAALVIWMFSTQCASFQLFLRRMTGW